MPFSRRSTGILTNLRSEDEFMAASCLKARAPNPLHLSLAIVILVVVHIYWALTMCQTQYQTLSLHYLI